MTNRAPVRTGPRPVVSVPKDATVMDAVRAMANGRVSATVILDNGTLLGVFTERDVALRVVLKGLNAETTPVAEVMTKKVVTVREDTDRSTVLLLMNENHLRHLPVVDAES